MGMNQRVSWLPSEALLKIILTGIQSSQIDLILAYRLAGVGPDRQ